jgi:3-phosphoshikimate 1-carboxyvinyltransferase
MKLRVPSSKSITQRALTITALTKGKTEIINPLFSEDTEYLINAFNNLGTTKKVSLGNNGTGVRFLTAFCTITNFTATITGNKRMQSRPIKDLVTALNQLGAKVSCENGCPPVTIEGKGTIKGGNIKLKGNLSSQYLSAILLIAPHAQNDVTIEIIGELTSKPYIDITIDVMKAFGVKVQNGNYKKFKVKAGQEYSPRKFEVEGDASSATYFQAIAHLKKIPLEITNLPNTTAQPDAKFKKLLTDKPIKADLNNMPDTVPLAAAVAALTKGKSRLTNIANLRIKECDRIAVMQSELKKIGIQTNSGKDWLEIEGNPDAIKPATIDPHNDHRIAMAFAVIKAIHPKIRIKNPSCVKKSYPNFWEDFKKITAQEK